MYFLMKHRKLNVIFGKKKKPTKQIQTCDLPKVSLQRKIEPKKECDHLHTISYYEPVFLVCQL